MATVHAALLQTDLHHLHGFPELRLQLRPAGRHSERSVPAPRPCTPAPGPAPLPQPRANPLPQAGPCTPAPGSPCAPAQAGPCTLPQPRPLTPCPTEQTPAPTPAPPPSTASLPFLPQGLLLHLPALLWKALSSPGASTELSQPRAAGLSAFAPGSAETRRGMWLFLRPMGTCHSA